MVLYYGLFALQTANNFIAGHRSDRQSKSPFIPSENSWIYTEDLKKRYHGHYYILIPIDTEKSNGHCYLIPWKPGRVNSWVDYRSIREHFSRSSIYEITKEMIPTVVIPQIKRR